MANCDCCEKIRSREYMLFEDDVTYVMLHPYPATEGHIVIIPKEHYPIIEQVPHEVVARLFNHANSVAISLFETMQAQGTNILMQNGIAAGQSAPHIMLHVLPRKQDDNINLVWQPKQITDDDMSMIETQMKEEAKNMHVPIGDDIQNLEKTKETIEENKEEDNYLVKHLKRIP